MVRHIRSTVAAITILGALFTVTLECGADADKGGRASGKETTSGTEPIDPVIRDLPQAVAKTYRNLFPGARVWQCVQTGKGEKATYELTVFYPDSAAVHSKLVDSAYVRTLPNYTLILNSAGGVIREEGHQISEKVVPEVVRKAFDEWRRPFPKSVLAPFVVWYAYQAEGAPRLYRGQVIINQIEDYSATFKGDGTLVEKTTRFSEDRQLRIPENTPAKGKKGDG
jgi:hypothetical protein